MDSSRLQSMDTAVSGTDIFASQGRSSDCLPACSSARAVTHPTADRGWHSGLSLLPGLLALKRLKSFPTSVPLG